MQTSTNLIDPSLMVASSVISSPSFCQALASPSLYFQGLRPLTMATPICTQKRTTAARCLGRPKPSITWQGGGHDGSPRSSPPSATGHNAMEVFDGQAQLYRHMYLWLSSACLRCAIELEIPAIIHKHGRPIPLSQLVLDLKVPPSKATFVQGLMRLLAHDGLFAIIQSNNIDEESKVSYDLTPPSQLLVTGTNYCVSSKVRWCSNPTTVDMYWHYLGKWIRGNESSLTETASGVGYWELLRQNPADLAAFHEGMLNDSSLMKVAMRDLESVLEGLSSIVDAGGGTGIVAKILCEAFPNLKCIVFDLPEVVAGLPGNTNLSFVGGDVLESIPQADAVLIKRVLIGFGDDDCIKILKNAKQAISANGKGGKVIIIEIMLNEKQDKHEMVETKLLWNVMLMAEFSGKVRSEEEFKQLFHKAGFTDYQTFSTLGFMSLIVLYP